ncbi:uncharacterized protein F4812DRAFT_250668 [Daldinia caldariorum]|uniref:uncharacterized protein n=1 Tax=Daldinia caldariorum TaxID=326644 RepID=UPI00200732F6|nr:uncharacterized protein F4812DRAFT_250668 [Daldinia caldariorum]KAI1463298.1 hypothetical protein F4812DRAFT_250668 [Daldinia caldariorum]
MVGGVSQFLKFGRKKTLDGTARPARASVPIDPARLKTEQRVPLASEILQRLDLVDSQLQSPLFGRLPRELRDLVWRYALTRYEDIDCLYDIQRTYARPGQAAPQRVAVELLETCRAVYIEAYLTPFQVNPIMVFHGDSNDVPPAMPLMRTVENPLLVRKLKYWQFANISSVEITIQQANLEGGGLERVSRLVGTKGRHHGQESRGYAMTGYAYFVSPVEPEESTSKADSKEVSDKPLPPLPNLLIGRKITHLSVRLSRTDWWGWEDRPNEYTLPPEERLRIEPMINVTRLWGRPGNYTAMTKGYEARKAGEEPDFQLDDFEKQGRWGMQVGEYCPDLTTLDLILETFFCKRNQLNYVAQCAKLWTFPLEDGFHLVWNGKEEAVRWRGAQSYKYERGQDWFTTENVPGRIEAQGYTKIRWGDYPDASEDSNRQEFVMRTLTFERRRIQ